MSLLEAPHKLAFGVTSKRASLLRVLRLKVILEKLVGDFVAQGSPIFERMTIMETGVDSGREDLVQPVGRIVESVSMGRAEDLTSDYDIYVRCSKEILHQTGDRARNAAVRGWIFRMVGSGTQRQPIGIGNESRIAAASLNRHNGPPEAVGVLGIEAADGRVGEASKENRLKPR